MCRFLVAVSAARLASNELLSAFAEMAEASRSPDGDRQGDGWGVAWLDAAGEWQRYRSLAPVWEEHATFGHVPATTALAIHARSASFAADRGELEHNQPYLLGQHAFVFNGLLAGVSLAGRRRGEIGAQRVAALLAAFLQHHPAVDAVSHLYFLLRRRARAIPALNLALCGAGRIVVISHFGAYPEYYQLHHAHDGSTALVCSQPLAGLPWRPLPQRSVTILNPTHVA
jgi:predicted glutamine amidotransferase